MTQTSELHAENVTPPDVVQAPVDGNRRRRVLVSRGHARPLLADRYRAFLALIGACVLALLLAMLPHVILGDTWLALVDGRQIADHGLPHHVVLTLFGYGHRWVDQQWLAQLGMYGLQRIGGLALVGVVNVALIGVALGGGAAASIRLGAGARSVIPVFLWVGIIVVFPDEVRTQAYAYPLFVLTVYLLASDSRRPTRTVYWCLPALVLWGNLHGSVTLGAGLVLLRGLTIVGTALRERRHALATWRRGLVLIAGAPLALLVTPYGTGVIAYYRATILSSAFRKYVTEWQPVTVDIPLAVLFFLLAGVVVWSLGRYGEKSTLWERAATLILAAGAILAVRNVVWFALAVLVLLPVWIDGAVRARERPAPARPRLNATLLAAAGVGVVLFAVSTLSDGAAKLTPTYPQGALAAVRTALDGHPAARVFSDEIYSDWLLWKLPGLRGRVAYDTSFELLSSAQLKAIADLKGVTGVDWLRAARGDRVLVLADGGDPNPVHAVMVQTGARLLYDRDGVAVLER